MLKEELQAYKNNEQLEHELSKINKDLETNFNIFD